MAVKGSTAPAITSPLLAWPAKPTPRTPLATPSNPNPTFESSSSYPSVMISQGDKSGGSLKGKGKSRADAAQVKVKLEEGVTMDIAGSEADGHGIPEKRYRPPQRPLSPQQLGRIAQSFGIEVPSLPTPPPSGSHGHGHSLGISPGRSTTPTSTLSAPYQPTRSSSCLLTVIPPISLLPPSTSAGSPEGLKRWRRGRLIPLQPTIGSMLLAIAREYGLPSTKGINLYVVNHSQHQQHQGRSSGSSSSDFSDEPGPRISSSTWTSLFASQVASASASRTSTPTGSPHRLGTLLARDNLPHSPLSPFSDMLHIRKDRDRQSSTASSSTLPAPTRPFGRDLVMPPTPSSLGSSASASASMSVAQSAVIATIEFDIDQEEATWFPTFQASGRRRNLSTASEGGVRQLRLLAKTSDERPRFLQDLDSNTSSESFPTTMTTATTSEGDSSFASKSEDHNNDSVDLTDVTILNSNGDELLAPFDLRKDLRVNADKRGSGIVMSEELDDLERVMRQLSPKEIRLTSPRVLTPRMAAKVANLQFPPPPLPRVTTRAGPAKSPLVNSFTDTESSPKMETDSHVTPDPSAARSAWPAVPYSKHSESPGSPQIDEYFKPPTRPSGESSRKSSYSDETIRRMKAEKEEKEESKPLSTEWKPRRPARPPSPNLQAHAPSHRRGISHSLSPELVSALRSPPQQSSPKSPDDEGKKGKSRSNSMSLKGLRASMSGKNVNWRKDEQQRDPMPTSTASRHDHNHKSEEPFGLFKQPIENSSSFPGLDTRQSTTTSTSNQSILSPNLSEFGSVDLNSPLPDISSTASLPVKQQPPQSGMRRLFSGSLPFKSRSSTSTSTTTESQPPPPPQQQRSSLKSRRNPSQDGASSFAISSPIPESFHRVDNGIGSIHPPQPPPSLSPPRRQPGSPGSPHALKRKPVPGDNSHGNGTANGNGQPGLPASVSFGSVASFVLEDAPKRRTRGQGEYR